MENEIRQKLKSALKAIQEREGQWMSDNNKRYVEFTVAEMRFLLRILPKDFDFDVDFASEGSD